MTLPFSIVELVKTKLLIHLVIQYHFPNELKNTLKNFISVGQRNNENLVKLKQKLEHKLTLNIICVRCIPY